MSFHQAHTLSLLWILLPLGWTVMALARVLALVLVLALLRALDGHRHPLRR
jgi:hypothetical protein